MLVAILADERRWNAWEEARKSSNAKQRQHSYNLGQKARRMSILVFPSSSQQNDKIIRLYFLTSSYAADAFQDWPFVPPQAVNLGRRLTEITAWSTSGPGAILVDTCTLNKWSNPFVPKNQRGTRDDVAMVDTMAIFLVCLTTQSSGYRKVIE